jgi:hypothetical protein
MMKDNDASRATPESEQRQPELFEGAKRRCSLIDDMLREQLAEVSQVADATVWTRTSG